MTTNITNKTEWRKQRRIELELPRYSLSEEVLNAVTHGVGTGLAVAGLIQLIINCHKDLLTFISVIIFGVTMIMLYAVSTLYHALEVNKGKKIFQILDHCTIFLLIAGTYTPISLLCIGGTQGNIMFYIVWGVAILGIILNAVNLKRFKKFSMFCYIALGWLVIFFFGPLIANLDIRGIFYLLIGGIFYTVGAILYNIGKKVKYMHSIWHLFVLAGTIFHYLVIYHISL